MTIAGSDSGGNAGVQADLRAFHAYGLHGCTVFAALTAQNPFGVSAIHAIPADFVGVQLDAVLGTYDIRALKTGMLAEPAIIETVAERLARHPEIAKVVDPVMIATSGAKLISDAAIETLKTRLLPLATLMTPNIPEAEALCGRSASARELAKDLQGRFGCAVLVKGGHGEGPDAVDVLYDGKGFREFTMPRVENPVSTHGTGCSLAAAATNDLQPAAVMLHPEIADVLATVRTVGATGVTMSGSGSCVFGFVPDEVTAVRLSSELNRRGLEAWPIHTL